MFPEEVICGAAVLLSHERERMQDWTANRAPPDSRDENTDRSRALAYLGAARPFNACDTL